MTCTYVEEIRCECMHGCKGGIHTKGDDGRHIEQTNKKKEKKKRKKKKEVRNKRERKEKGG